MTCRPPPASRRVAALWGLAAVAALLLNGCKSVLHEPEVDYLSNRTLLALLAQAVPLVVPEDELELHRAEILEDALTFYYRGVRYPGDAAWILRFSIKSTEQDPTKLTDVYALLPIVSEGRRGFRVEDEGTETLNGATLRWVSFRFDSPIRGEDGRPLEGRGIVGTLEREIEGHPVVFHFKIDNWGDRTRLNLEDIRYLIRALLA